MEVFTIKDKEVEKHVYVADFETTVEQDIKEQERTEVWASAIVEMRSENVIIENNIYDFMDYLSKLEDGSIVYFHNLKFDGSFILQYLQEKCYSLAFGKGRFLPYKLFKHFYHSYQYSISYMGQWYCIKINFNGNIIEIRDSLKLIPFSVAQMGKGFMTKHRKLEMQYEDTEEHKHTPFGKITDHEKEYIANDVLVVKEVLEILYDENIKELTIGSACLKKYKEMTPDFNLLFPDMTKEKIADTDVYHYCKNAYSGGWCYMNPQAKGKIFEDGFVLDVNSLYPSVMYGNYENKKENIYKYPVGLPTYNTGEPTKQEEKEKAIFRRFKCRFKIKKGKLPFVHIRNEFGYKSNECLTTTDIMGSRYYILNGDKHDTIHEFTMTQMDFELFKEHYKIMNYEPIDYITFETEQGIFDNYIDFYKKMKIENDGNAKRQIAKLFLNNLYGKLSTSDDSSFKLVDEVDDILKFETVYQHDKKPVYIPCGAYITSYARNFTIRAAQQLYYEGEDKGFMYADTDSVHCVNMNVKDIPDNIKIHNTEFLRWKPEASKMRKAKYVRQKTYYEEIIEENFKPVKGECEISLKGCGMGKNTKKAFIDGLQNGTYELKDFDIGLVIKGTELRGRQVKGGVLLVPSDFTMR